MRRFLFVIAVSLAASVLYGYQSTPTQAQLDNAKLKAAADAATTVTDIQQVDAIANQILGARLAADEARITALEKAAAATLPASGLTVVKAPSISTHSLSAVSATASHEILLAYDTSLVDPDFPTLIDQAGVCASAWQHVAPATNTSALGENWGAWWCGNASGLTGDLLPSDETGVIQFAAIEIANASKFSGAVCTPNDLAVTPAAAALLFFVGDSQTPGLKFQGWSQQAVGTAHWNEYFESENVGASSSLAWTITSTASFEGCIFYIE